ncbi:hypothetical protein ZWY2020_052926 [Hordeum vulgare]|nr:hypothetical protein ZWY2020_052926 [Hordeum vulgare]
MGPGRRRRMSSVDAAGNPSTPSSLQCPSFSAPLVLPHPPPGPLGRCSADPWYNSRTWYWVCWVLVHKVGLGSKGAALASAVSYSTDLAILCLYTRLSGACRRTWTGFSMEAFAFKELPVMSSPPSKNDGLLGMVVV